MLKTDRSIQQHVVFGPVLSRRFGASLGINFLPFGRKTCSFDCRYCELGWTTSQMSDWRHMASPDTLLPLVEEGFERVAREQTPVKVLTIAGNGEPTLHPDFSALVDGVLGARDKWLPHVPVVILSNSSTVHRLSVRQALRRLDRCYMKLDVGTIPLWHALNRPYGRYLWHQMLDGLRAMDKVCVQSLFVCGSVDNASDDAVEPWIEALKYVRPLGVQIYTLDRVPADLRLQPVSGGRLHEIGALVETFVGTPVEVIEPDGAFES